MRLYAFLLVAAAALHARAANIPVPETEKKLIDIVPEDSDKTPENISSEQELIDQTNLIKDVENKLRVKPEDIPVEVIVEDAQSALKTDDGKDESEEVDRPGPDLRNPGPPQRQEHETQNPEYYATEQQTVLNFKQSLNDAQNILRQGFQGITNGIQNMFGENVQISAIQQSIQSLREGFTAQINKINGTIQNYLNSDSSSINLAAVEQTKASFHQIEKGLNSLRNDFNREVNTLADGVDVFASLKAENENPVEDKPSSSSTVAPANPSPSPAPVNPFVAYLQNLQIEFNNRLQNFTNMITNFAENQGWNSGNQASSTPPAVSSEVQSDVQVPTAAPASPNLWQNFQNQITTFLGQGQNQGSQSFLPQPGQIAQAFQNNPIIQSISSFWPNSRPGGQASQGTQPTQPAASTQPTPAVQPASVAQPSNTDSKPTETSNKPEAQGESAQPATTAQAAAVTPVGPIRQILQNNPISKGIADAVQRLQNINNPDKPREVEKVEEQHTEEIKNQDENKSDSVSIKGYHNQGGGANTGDNNDNSNSSDRIEDNEAVKETEKLSEDLKPKEDELKEHKTVTVVDKTE